jgi:hypothetical protein
LTQLGVAVKAVHGLRPTNRVIGAEKNRSVTCDLGKAGSDRADDWATACLSLQDWQAETFVKRWEHKSQRATQQSRLVCIGYIARENDPVLNSLAPNSGKQVVREPSSLPCKNKGYVRVQG